MAVCSERGRPGRDEGEGRRENVNDLQNRVARDVRVAYLQRARLRTTGWR